MSKYIYPEAAGEISGFGGGYEDACRKMVISGMEWIDEHPKCILDYKEYKNVYGITTDETPDVEQMQEHMNKAINNEASGAMMQACLGHIMFAHKNGWDKYIEEMSKENSEA